MLAASGTDFVKVILRLKWNVGGRLCTIISVCSGILATYCTYSGMLLSWATDFVQKNLRLKWDVSCRLCALYKNLRWKWNDVGGFSVLKWNVEGRLDKLCAVSMCVFFLSVTCLQLSVSSWRLVLTSLCKWWVSACRTSQPRSVLSEVFTIIHEIKK